MRGWFTRGRVVGLVLLLVVAAAGAAGWWFVNENPAWWFWLQDEFDAALLELHYGNCELIEFTLDRRF